MIDYSGRVGAAKAYGPYEQWLKRRKEQKATAWTGVKLGIKGGKAISDINRKQINQEMFGQYTEHGKKMFQLKQSDNFLDRLSSNLWRQKSDYELTESAQKEGYVSDESGKAFTIKSRQEAWRASGGTTSEEDYDKWLARPDAPSRPEVSLPEEEILDEFEDLAVFDPAKLDETGLLDPLEMPPNMIDAGLDPVSLPPAAYEGTSQLQDPSTFIKLDKKYHYQQKSLFPSSIIEQEAGKNLLQETGKPLTDVMLKEGGEEVVELAAEEGVKSAVGQYAGPAVSTFMAGKTILDPKASGTDKALGGTSAALDIASAVPGPHQPFTLAASLGVKLLDMFV